MGMTQPRWVHSCFGPKYETNRTKLREVLIESVEKNVWITFNCAVEGLRQCGQKAELLGKDGLVLGLFDLVVDTSGVGSSLRRYRINDTGDADPEKVDRHTAFSKAYTGVSMVHGVILDPEASCDKALVEKLGQGTLTLLGPHGQTFSVQRYGSD